MDVSWTTVICSVTGSIVASGIFSGVFSGVVAKILQCIFDKKLVDQKKDIQKMLNEHQIQYKYWHEEKAKAIRNFYGIIVEMCYELREYKKWVDTPIEENDEFYQKFLKGKIKEKTTIVSDLSKTLFTNWLKLRLFLDKEEDMLIDKFISREHSVIETIILNKNGIDLQQEQEKATIFLNEMVVIMNDLKKQFKKALMVKDANMESEQTEKGQMTQ